MLRVPIGLTSSDAAARRIVLPAGSPNARYRARFLQALPDQADGSSPTWDEAAPSAAATRRRSRAPPAAGRCLQAGAASGYQPGLLHAGPCSERPSCRVAGDLAHAHAGWADKLTHTLGVPLASIAPSVWHNQSLRADARTRGAVLSELELSRAAQKAIGLAQQEKSAWTRADVIKYLGRVLPGSGMDPATAAVLLEDLGAAGYGRTRGRACRCRRRAAPDPRGSRARTRRGPRAARGRADAKRARRARGAGRAHGQRAVRGPGRRRAGRADRRSARVGAGARGRHAAIVRELQMPVLFDLGQFVAGLERQRHRPIRQYGAAPGLGWPCRGARSCCQACRTRSTAMTAGNLRGRESPANR
jgi:hypothetical protein